MISTVGHFLVFTLRDIGLRTNRADDHTEHFLVLRSKVVVHDAINDRVDGTAEKPQASSEDENLRRRKQFNW